MGTPGLVKAAAFKSTDEMLHEMGNNSGNLLFQYAVHNKIDEKKLRIGKETSWNASEIREKCRVIVIPAANFIRENFDFTPMANFVEKIDLPLVVIGLGTQAPSLQEKKLDFHKSVLRFLSVIKERCDTIGVRGEFSRETLDGLGVTNTVVMGCPSNFINPDPCLHEKLKIKWDNPSESVLITGNEIWPNSNTEKLVSQKLVAWASEKNSIYIQQSVQPFYYQYRKNNVYSNTDIYGSSANALRLAMAPEMTENEFHSFLLAKTRTYICVDQWMDDSARFDISIGLRLHGNMVAFQAGCPAVWIYHDSRTQELTETMALPSISSSSFIKCKDVNDLKRNLNVDFEKYGKVRQKLKIIYEKILTDSDIKIVNGC